MGIKRHLDEAKAHVVISIDGRFDFSVHKAFRDAYRDIDPNIKHFVVDLSSTDYMDSSALGMLLLLRDYAGNDPSRVRIRGSRDEVLRVLKIANFERLFVID